jgi:hypothetical protein
MRLQILVPSARRYGSTLAASSRTVARSTPSSSAHCCSGAAIGRPTSRSSDHSLTAWKALANRPAHGPLRTPADILTAFMHLGCALICARKLKPL